MHVSVPASRILLLSLIPLLSSSVSAAGDGRRRCESSSVFCFDMDEKGGCWVRKNVSHAPDQGSGIFSLTLQKSITFADSHHWTLRFADSLQTFDANISLKQLSGSSKIELQVGKNNSSKVFFGVCLGTESCIRETDMDEMAKFFIRRDKDDDSKTNTIRLQSTTRLGKQIGMNRNPFSITVHINGRPATNFTCHETDRNLTGNGTIEANGRQVAGVPMCTGLGILAGLFVMSIIVAVFLIKSRRIHPHKLRQKAAVVRSSNRLRMPSRESLHASPAEAKTSPSHELVATHPNPESKKSSRESLKSQSPPSHGGTRRKSSGSTPVRHDSKGVSNQTAPSHHSIPSTRRSSVNAAPVSGPPRRGSPHHPHVSHSG